MRPWGMQKFLNPPEHDDNGFVVAHVSPNKKPWRGFSAELTVADCDRRAHLTFDPQDFRVGYLTEEVKASVAKSIKERRAKVKILREVVVSFCDKMDAALDEYEEELNNAAVDRDS